ncbi:shikimate dehydrogenase [Pleionea mediterranea]|uniref:shikimate dehydrogenase (NADP(+)) n=1 Tax=Pleionea mediterranea TaxID=523701 RepID=A0A316FW61_9GAMM|nr:shikimate dehydrogenase [Pleionea mediterranea]PWK52809.1 shikimate dehydrogenase [Pleionea mediterranea]
MSELKTNTKRYAVIGNPVEHSLSPGIHQQFAAQFQPLDRAFSYEKILASQQGFATKVSSFFADGGLGMNVTLPFKHDAFQLCKQVSERVEQCQSVNTLYLNEQQQICGETTDGAGLLNDLKNKGMSTAGRQILVLGAGGAARSIIPELLAQQASVQLLNRTQANAEQLIKAFGSLGDITLCEKSTSGAPNNFDLIINTLPKDGEHWLEAYSIRSLSGTHVYDISYGERAEPFLQWCRDHKAYSVFDGWGMLVEQAALSFQLWHGLRPDTRMLIQQGSEGLSD